MSLGYLLFWWILAGAVFQVVRTFRDPGTEAPSWAVGSVVVAATMAIVALVSVDLAGVVGLFLWTLFITTPRSILASITRVLKDGRFVSARRRSRFLVLFHPSRSHRVLKNRLVFLTAVPQGAFNQGVLASWAGETTIPTADLAVLEFLTERGEWSALLEWTELAKSSRGGGVSATLFIPYFLRATAESGDRETLLHAIVDISDFLETNPTVRRGAQILVLAFMGAVEELRTSFAAPTRDFSVERLKFWHATALLCSENVPPALTLLKTLETDAASPKIRAEAKLRLAQYHQGFFPKQALDLGPLATFFAADPAPPRFQPWGTYVIAGINIALFLAVYFLPGGARLYEWGVLQPFNVPNGEWWTVLTAAFLHQGILHIAMNMVALVIVGSGVEFVFGTARFLSLYFTTAIASNGIVTILALKGFVDTPGLVGASGAVMGMIGISAAELLKEWRRERSAHSLRRLSDVGIAMAIQVAFDLSTPRVSFTAHIAGLLTGFVLGMASKRPK